MKLVPHVNALKIDGHLFLPAAMLNYQIWCIVAVQSEYIKHRNLIRNISLAHTFLFCTTTDEAFRTLLENIMKALHTKTVILFTRQD
jgi:hypothetical protein